MTHINSHKPIAVIMIVTFSILLCATIVSSAEQLPAAITGSDATATTHDETSSTNQHHRNQLKTSLNESLAKFLQATDQRQRLESSSSATRRRHISNNTAQHDDNTTSLNLQQQQQLKVQQQLNNKMISCEELSLVVLAQKALNISFTSGAISRLIECKQENLLDMNLVSEIFQERSTSQGATATTITNDSSTTLKRSNDDQAVRQRAQQDSSGGLIEDLQRQQQQQSAGVQLHFGAKLAISLLVTIITLVLVATFVDYRLAANQGGARDASTSCGRRNERKQQNGGARRRNKKKEQQVAKLRDYRSLSMSSQCSSNLFCSTNSVASSSAPILGRTSADGAAKQQHLQRQHYEANLQLHFNQQSSISSISAVAGGCGTSASECQQHEQQQHALPDSSSKQDQTSIDMTCARDEIVHHEHDEVDQENQSAHSSESSLELARQVLLAFSLRQSAKQILDQAPPTRRKGGDLHEKSSYDRDDCRNVQSGARCESVSSLHGLRFLSMIWVIVIHSYNFALRWMFFSNTNTLDGIYKSTASQLIANGSFACDSFFFAGGFLLPYLASYPAPRARPEEATSTREGEGKSGATSGGGGTTTGCCESVSTCCCCSSGGAHVDQQKPTRHELHTNEHAHERGSSATNVRVTITNSSAEETKPDEGPPHQSTAPCFAHFCNRKSAAKVNGQRRENSGKSSSPAATSFTWKQILANVCHRYARMMPLMMAIIGLCSTLLRYLGEGPLWQESTMMYDEWCRKNWWINALFLHNFESRENMCLSHSWYSAVDFQLFLVGQLILWTLNKSKRAGYALLLALLASSPLLTMVLTLKHHLPAVPLVSNVSEETMNLYYGEIYIKPYSRASPYLIGMLLAYALRTTRLAHWQPRRWQVALGWTASLATFAGILLAMQPAMNGRAPSELESALYSGWSRPAWACATGWMIYACMTKHGGIIDRILSARLFVPLSKLTYPAFLIHPIIMALFYGSRATSFQFSHYLMLYLILGNIVITYASAFVLAVLFELPLLSIERTLSKRLFSGGAGSREQKEKEEEEKANDERKTHTKHKT